MFDGFVLTCSIGGDGPRVAVKDTIDVAGLPTRGGSRALEDAGPAQRHAETVRRLIARGCRIVGKTALHELAFGVSGVNGWSGTPVNPGFPLLVPGGSSSGSASVVAAGLVDFALGTDTGGSIRMPSACCGIFGLKPTFGRISRDGVLPARSSLDCVGPMARSLAMIETAMAMMDDDFLPEPAPTTARLGLLACAAGPRIAAAVEAACKASGAEVEPVELPAMEAAFDAGLTIINAETFAAFAGLLATGKLGADVAARLAAAGKTTPEAVAAAEVFRARFSADVDRALESVDALVLPTLPGFPLKLADALAGRTDLRATSLVRPFNLSGHPALALPLAPIDGQPVSLQLVGGKGGDAALCALARRLFPEMP